MKYSMLAAVALAASSAIAVSCSIIPAAAQRNDNPNIRNFYMARQQVQIYDDAPMVNDMRTAPGAAGAPAPAVTAPQQLPRAGFNTYMSGYAGGNARAGLPQVINGVPPKLPSAPALTGQKAHAGKLKAKSPPAPKGPAVAKSYQPYATYQPAATGGSTAPASSSGSMLNSSGSVRGSVLHWNKKRGY